MQKVVGYFVALTLVSLLLIGVINIVYVLIPFIAFALAIALPIFGCLRKLNISKTQFSLKKTLRRKKMLSLSFSKLYIGGFVIGMTYQRIAMTLVKGIGVLLVSIIGFGILWEVTRAVLKATAKYEIVSFKEAISSAV